MIDKLGNIKENLASEIPDKVKEWIFGMFVETNHESIAAAFNIWLSKYSLADFSLMISQGKMPDIPNGYFAEVSGFGRYLDNYSVEDMMELIGDANVELLQLILSHDKGYSYMVKLRNYLIESIKAVEAGPVPPAPSADTVLITCEKCGKRWPVKKGDVDAIEKCPFCGEKA